jgi:hypothetical protein
VDFVVDDDDLVLVRVGGAGCARRGDRPRDVDQPALARSADRDPADEGREPDADVIDTRPREW